MNGTVFVSKLKAKCHVGCTAKERKRTQPIVIDISCVADMTKAVHSDRRSDCVDYSVLRKIARRIVKETRYRLLEALAHYIAVAMFVSPLVEEATVMIRKPKKLKKSRDVGISLTITRAEIDRAR